MRRPFLLVLALGLVLLGTACGSTANTYRSQVDTVQKQYQPKLKPLESRLATAIGDRRTADAAELAAKTAEVFEQAASAVAAVHPPSKLETRAATLVAAYRKLVSSLHELKTALHTNAATPINEAIASYNAARLDETSAIAALNAG